MLSMMNQAVLCLGSIEAPTGNNHDVDFSLVAGVSYDNTHVMCSDTTVLDVNEVGELHCNAVEGYSIPLKRKSGVTNNLELHRSLQNKLEKKNELLVELLKQSSPDSSSDLLNGARAFVQSTLYQ